MQAQSTLRSFGPSLYVAEGGTVSFFGFPYPTRMAVARLSSGLLWVWSPVALTPDLAAAVEAVGRVAYIVTPNKLHHLFLADWHEHWPGAQLYAPPGLARKVRLPFADELTDGRQYPWSSEIDQSIMPGSLFMKEVIFFHRASLTAIFGDLIQRFPEGTAGASKRLLLRLGGILGNQGSTPRDWRLSFLSRTAARDVRARILGWKPERLLIAHGECAARGATQIIREALRWI